MKIYDYTSIEKKWQEYWDKDQTFKVVEDPGKEKFYVLVEFPYPSGQGLHIGHPRPYTAMDVLARKRRLEGYNVLYPFGWDAFGLPTENFAIKNKIHPEIVTADNIKSFTRQAKAIGFSFDWSREVNTTDPSYYKWTQWIFLQLFKKGLAYKKEMAVNWCTGCKVVLANEEVVDGSNGTGVCERCNSQVVRKVKKQWMLKITEYAQRLIDDLDDVDYPERVKAGQINWIGRSTGAEVDFDVVFDTGENTPLSGEHSSSLRVYTTRPDTLFGATYMVVSPEHPLIEAWADRLSNIDEVRAEQEKASQKSDFERSEMNKGKSGVRLHGVCAVNPVTKQEIPIFISDYVLMSYGTGAIMAVPGHDTRDWEFAKAFNLPVIEVVQGGDIEKEAFTACDTGIMVNSGFLDGLSVEDAKAKIIEWLCENKLGVPKVNFKLRDWVFSRQRYWGEPIPVVYCENCGGWVAVPESELPLKLPEVESYMPTDTGESPLAALDEFINTVCPVCGSPAKRETDTMPQWAGSSWYFLRYCDPHNDKELISKEKLAYWCKNKDGNPPVDWYNGGMEHTTLHLLYSRFWHKFLYDIGVVTSKEPYAKRTSHGMILGEDMQKMSKSRGNVINPDDVIREFGADGLRLYEMFVGDFEKVAPWSINGIKGCKRFLDRVWALQELVGGNTAPQLEVDEYRPELRAVFHRTIKKVARDIENLKYNTAIAALMSLINEIYASGAINRAELRTFLLLLNPFAPHITEEMFQEAGFGILNRQSWPKYDEALCQDDEAEIVVQVNGKVRAKAVVSAGCDREQMVEIAKSALGAAIEGKTIVKEIVVPNKLVNIVVRD